LKAKAVGMEKSINANDFFETEVLSIIASMAAV
jgi:hypothetical protein